MANRQEKVKAVTDFIFFLSSQITAGGDCSLEIKRCLLLGRKAMTHLDSILKIKDITLPTKVHLVKAMVFPVVMYGCESWTQLSDWTELICHEMMGPDAKILVFLMLSFKPALFTLLFYPNQRFFSFSSVSAIRVVSSAYLRLLIFLPAILIPAYDSSSPVFYMMYSA